MQNGQRTDVAGPNVGHRGGRSEQTADPNEFLIQLETSAIRLTWSRLGQHNRLAMGVVRVRPLRELAFNISRQIAESA